MRLHVAIPANRIPERTYVVEAVLKAFLGLDLVVQVDSTRQDTRITAEGSDRDIVLLDGLLGVGEAAWLKPPSLPTPPLARWRQEPDSQSGLPLLYGSTLPNGNFTGTRDDTLVVGADLLGSIFFLLTQYEELANPARDPHSRFLAEFSILSSEDELLSTPLADRYVEALWSLLSGVWPHLARARGVSRLRVTCDVDHPLANHERPLRSVFKATIADVVLRKDPGLAVRRIGARASGGSRAHDGDPNNTFDLIMREAVRADADVTFYFPVGGTGHELDTRTSIQHPWMVNLLRRITDAGHEIGIHPSYDSTSASIESELAELVTVLERSGIEVRVAGGRQHYLRWTNPETWRVYQQLGLGHDASVGFPDRPGFRAGTTRDFAVFDLEQAKPLDIIERPLHLMDASVTDYLGRPIAQMAEFGEQLAEHALRVDGNLNLLWHNDRVISTAQQRSFVATVHRTSALLG